jgi:tRNA-uridine 2-sulfurtransferase
VAVDVPGATVTVGTADDLLVDRVELDGLTWVGDPVACPLVAQVSAHGVPRPCRVDGATVAFERPERRVAPGQSVVLYDGDAVVAGGTARAARH